MNEPRERLVQWTGLYPSVIRRNDGQVGHQDNTQKRNEAVEEQGPNRSLLVQEQYADKYKIKGTKQSCPKIGQAVSRRMEPVMKRQRSQGQKRPTPPTIECVVLS